MDRVRGEVFLRVVAAGIVSAGGAACGKVASTTNDAALDAMVDAPMIDAMVDAMIDAPPPHKFEIGYINELTLAPNNRVLLGFLLLVNVSTVPLNAADLTIVSFGDNSPAVEWEFFKDQDASMRVAPGRAAGLISPVARDKIVTPGIVTEQNDDTFFSLGMSFVTPPPADVTFNAQVVLRIDGETITLPFTIHTLNTNMVTFHSAARVASHP
jgi:hypothetical protein